MTEYLFFTAFAFLFLLAGYLFGSRKKKPHISGKLLIDTTGEKDRWTIFFDDDLGDIEKMDQVTLSIERRAE